MAGTSIGLWGTTWLVVATTRTRSPASAASAVRTRWLPESWAVLGATRTSGSSPGGSSIGGCGTSNTIGPVTFTAAGQLPRVLELGVGGDQRQVGADAAVEALDRGEADPLALQVEVTAAVLEADVERPLSGPPDRPPERRPRRPQPDREEGQPRLDDRVDVRDQGRQRHPGPLGRQRRRQREDVADGDVRPHLLQQRQQRPSCLGGVLAVGGVRLRRREHPVFLCRGKAEPGSLDGGPALLPGLDHDLVPARRQGASEGDRREGVAGVAEGGDQDPQWRARAARPHRGVSQR